MKKYLLAAFGLCSLFQGLNAQDRIVKTDSTRIESKVMEVGDAEIKYKKFSNPDGPQYSLKKSEIAYILFQNGEREVYNTPSLPPPVIVSITDLLVYVQTKLDVTLQNSASEKGGVEVIGTGPNNRITGNWPGPRQWTIRYAGAGVTKRALVTKGALIKNTDDLLKEIVNLRAQGKKTLYLLLQRNGSVLKPFRADISDLDFPNGDKNYNGEKNSLINLTVIGIAPIKERSGDSNCIAVIGRDMCRVNAYVKALREKFADKGTHIETWNDEVEDKFRFDQKKTLDANVQNDGDWLCDKIKKGCTIIDIGCDPNYKCNDRTDKPFYDCSVPSPFYEREQLIAFGSYDCMKGVTTTTVSPTTITPNTVSPTTVSPTNVKPKAMNPFTNMSGSIKPVLFYVGTGISVKNSYAIGQPFWDFIDRLAASAGQEGSIGEATGYLPFYFGFELPVNKKHTSFLGVELQYIHTNKEALVSFSTFAGYEFYLHANMFNLALPVGFGLGPLGRTSVVVEPALIMGTMGGQFAFAPDYDRYNEAGTLGLGGHFAAGINSKFGKNVGARFRVGERFLTIPEVHQSSTSATGYASFYVNGTDGPTLQVNWGGFFITACMDIYF